MGKWFRKIAKCPHCGRREAMDFHEDLYQDGLHECKWCHQWYVFGIQDGCLICREALESELHYLDAVFVSLATEHPNLYRIRFYEGSIE